MSENVLTFDRIRELLEAGQITITVNPLGWLCPRCGKVNAPDVRQCDCQPGCLPNTVIGPSETKAGH